MEDPSSRHLVRLVQSALARDSAAIVFDICAPHEEVAGALIRRLSETPDFHQEPWTQSITRFFHDKQGREVQTCTTLDTKREIVVNHTRTAWRFADETIVQWCEVTASAGAMDVLPVSLRDLHEREDNVHTTHLCQSRTFWCDDSPWRVHVAVEWHATTTTQVFQALRACTPPLIRIQVKAMDVHNLQGRFRDPQYFALDGILKLAFVFGIPLVTKDGNLDPHRFPSIYSKPAIAAGNGRGSPEHPASTRAIKAGSGSGSGAGGSGAGGGTSSRTTRRRNGGPPVAADAAVGRRG